MNSMRQIIYSALLSGSYNPKDEVSLPQFQALACAISTHLLRCRFLVVVDEKQQNQRLMSLHGYRSCFIRVNLSRMPYRIYTIFINPYTTTDRSSGILGRAEF